MEEPDMVFCPGGGFRSDLIGIIQPTHKNKQKRYTKVWSFGLGESIL